MSDARERIAEVVDEYGAWPGNTDPAVSEILTIVREALTGPAAKEEASHFASYDNIEAVIDSAMNAGLGTRFVTEGYDMPLGADDDGGER